uniref:MHD domain-containing protein n=1 Tax=Macrostomum lignano TaxID=282301 RepID=A0A1I8FML9_9PLAT
VTRRPTEVKVHVRASKEHDGKVLACKFVQDERLIEWKREKLSVFFQFSISYSDVGNPSAKHFCRIGSRPLTDA